MSGTCANPECPVAEDGKCLEGYATAECPHYGGHSVEELAEAVEIEVEGDEASPPIHLHAGRSLDRSEASRLQRTRRSRTVAILGPNNSGKTSLISGVYDLFQEGPIGEYLFAGSATFPEFEKICHDARAASRRETPYTPRTIVGADAKFFHFDVGAHDEITSVFIADRSGEDYLAMADSLSQADGYFELRRADTIVVLVNGEDLVSNRLRHEVKAITPQLVDALAEAGAIRPGQRMAIALTKYDAVLASEHADRARSEFAGIVDDLTTRHVDRLHAIQPFYLAASPKDGSMVRRGEGIPELLDYWMLSAPQEQVEHAPRAVPARFIDSVRSAVVEISNE